MVTSSNFIANEYHLAFNLQKAFHDYVALYTQLHYPENRETVANKDRQELTLKLQESVNEISLLALEMKQGKSEAKALKHTNKPSVCTTERSSLMPC